MMSFFDGVGFLISVFLWLLGLAFVAYSVITTARNTWRQLKRGIVEEGLDIQRAAHR